jgi:glycerol-3-phosphate dehydrogenase
MGKDNVAIGLDEQHQRLFVGCRSGNMVIFDSNTGKELQALPITKGVDDVQYDAASKRFYAIGAGTVDVYREGNNADYATRTIQLVQTIGKPTCTSCESSLRVESPGDSWSRSTRQATL